MRVLITGGGGFLGAWIIRQLSSAGMAVRVFDASDDRSLVKQFAGAEAAANLQWLNGDIADFNAVLEAAIDCDAIIHLAGVLTPACRVAPLLGVRVNVLGTLNVFEAAKRHGISKVIYTSSGGVFGPSDDVVPFPTTHYGAFKLANEGNARAYWEDAGIASIGFRPFVVYGPGRETGLSAGPTIACRAAAQGQSYVIPLTGKLGLVYVEDVAAAYFKAVEAPLIGAHTINLTGHAVEMDDVVTEICRIVPGAKITCQGPSLPSVATVRNEWANGLLSFGVERTLKEGLELTVEYYRRAVRDLSPVLATT
jgi:nucleoside-diphosphate-sugar epimerase